MLNCPNCGAENNDDYQVCSSCGASREAPKEKASRKKVFIAGGILAFILVMSCIVLAGLLWLDVISLPSGGGQILLGFPNRDGEVDLKLLKVGQDEEKAALLAEGVFESRANFYMLKDMFYTPVGGRYGGFVPGTKDVYFWYADEDKRIFISQADARGKDPTLIFDSKYDFVSGLFLDSGDLLLREVRTDDNRCYLSESGKEAERIAKGNFCWITLDSKKLVVTEKDSRDYTLTLVNLKNLDETIVIDNQEDVAAAIVSYDGSTAAYLQVEDESQLFLVDGRKGEELADGEKYSGISNYSFLGETDTLYYLGLERDGDAELQVLSADDSTRVASGDTIKVVPSRIGNFLVYLLGDKDGEEAVYVYSVNDGVDFRLERGDDLEFAVMESPEQMRILIISRDRDEVTLLSSDVDGENLTQLYSDDNLSLGAILQVDDRPILFVLMSDEDRMQSLYITPYDRPKGFFLIEDWADIRLRNISPDGSTLLFTGREDPKDDMVLYAIKVGEDAEPVELDDDVDDGILNAVFTPNGKEAIYTVITGGDADDFEVRQVRVDGKNSPEQLYRDAFLIDIQWDQLFPFRQVHFQKP